MRDYNIYLVEFEDGDIRYVIAQNISDIDKNLSDIKKIELVALDAKIIL